MVNVTNSTVTDGVNYLLHEQSIPLWVRVLALFGALYLVNTIARTGVSLVMASAYGVGTLKFLYVKIIKREDKNVKSGDTLRERE